MAAILSTIWNGNWNQRHKEGYESRREAREENQRSLKNTHRCYLDIIFSYHKVNEVQPRELQNYNTSHYLCFCSDLCRNENLHRHVLLYSYLITINY